MWLLGAFCWTIYTIVGLFVIYWQYTLNPLKRNFKLFCHVFIRIQYQPYLMRLQVHLVQWPVFLSAQNCMTSEGCKKRQSIFIRIFSQILFVAQVPTCTASTGITQNVFDIFIQSFQQLSHRKVYAKVWKIHVLLSHKDWYSQKLLNTNYCIHFPC